MPQYVIAYLGGNQPATPEEGQQHFAKYQAWLVALGDAAVSPANPFKNTHTVHPDGSAVAGSTSAMSGYTLVAAACMDEALAIAKACPFLDLGGSLEVSELIEMSM